MLPDDGYQSRVLEMTDPFSLGACLLQDRGRLVVRGRLCRFLLARGRCLESRELGEFRLLDLTPRALEPLPRRLPLRIKFGVDFALDRQDLGENVPVIFARSAHAIREGIGHANHM